MATSPRRCRHATSSLPSNRSLPERSSSANPLAFPPGGGPRWAGRTEGLTDREAEVLALITQGKSNADIATLMYLSINTVKSYIRSAYRKIGVSTPGQAILWGVYHGFTPDHHRIDHWHGGP